VGINNLLKSKLEQFIAKRVLIFFIVLAILDIVFINKRWFVLIGLMLGGVLSILKFGSYAMFFEKLIVSVSSNHKKNHGAGSGIIVFVLNQLILIPVMFITMKINYLLFEGFVSGVLLVPFVLLVNCITEVIRITHNNFE
jgi:hypothetical protein